MGVLLFLIACMVGRQSDLEDVMLITYTGHILATLLGIPHVIIDNKIGKVTDYHSSWTASCDLVRVASSPADAISQAAKFFENEKK